MSKRRGIALGQAGVDFVGCEPNTQLWTGKCIHAIMSHLRFDTFFQESKFLY
jgi:hypothetical protein